MKYRFLQMCVFLVVLSLLAACGAPAAEQPGTGEMEEITTSSGFVCPLPEHEMQVTSKELNLFVWTEYIPVDMVECFEKVYNVTVNLEEYSSNEEMYAKLSAGGTNYDLVQPTDYIVPLMVRQDLLQKLDKGRLPALSNFDANYLNQSFDPGNEYTIPYQSGIDAIVVNSEKVASLPARWADLWNPEFAGRMVFLDDSRVVIGLTLLTLGYDVNTKDEAQLEEAKVRLAELVQGIKLFDSDSPKTALIAGDVDLGMTWTGEAFLASQENPAIQFIYPEEGAILWMDNWAMPASAPHADAAYSWINYSNHPAIFWLMLRDFPYTNPNKAALDFARQNHPDLFNVYNESAITNPPKDVLEKGHRIEDVGDATPIYDRIWTEVKGGE